MADIGKMLEDISEVSNGELVKLFQEKLAKLETKVASYEKDMLEPKPEDMKIMRRFCHEGVDSLDIYRLKRCVDFMWGIGDTPEMIQLHMIASDHKDYKDFLNRRMWILFSLISAVMSGLAFGIDVPTMLEIAREIIKIVFMK